MAGKPCVLETCPASTRKRLHLYSVSYRDRNRTHRDSRERILTAIRKKGNLSRSRNTPERVLDDANGDGLDSVIGAYATLRAFGAGGHVRQGNDHYKSEGYAYN